MAESRHCEHHPRHKQQRNSSMESGGGGSRKEITPTRGRRGRVAVSLLESPIDDSATSLLDDQDAESENHGDDNAPNESSRAKRTNRVSFSLPSGSADAAFLQDLGMEMDRRRSGMVEGAFSSSFRNLQESLLDEVEEEENEEEGVDDDDSFDEEEFNRLYPSSSERGRGGLQRQPSNYRASFRETVSPSGMSTSFWDDCRNFTPGSVPHSTVLGITIGIVCGVVAFAYYTSLEWLLDKLWKELPEWIFVPNVDPSLHWLWIPALGLTMAVCVGLSVRLLGEPGDLAYTVQCVHNDSYIEMNHVIPMLAASQFSILGGGSLGPEAPLVAICASFAGFISRKVFKQTRMNLVRKHTLMGMACALAAFFGVPLGGSIFALEINSRWGIEYYEHLVEAIFSGTVCICVFRGLAGLEIAPLWSISTDPLGPSHPTTVVIGAAIGLMAAGVASLFATFHKGLMSYFASWGLLDNKLAVWRALLGASVMLTIGLLIPHTLFWGELEFEPIAKAAPANKLPHVFPTSGLIGFEMNSFWTAILVGFAKMVAVSFTVAGGHRGGYIFPLFAAGAAFGRAIVYIVPSLSPTVATLCFAAGINVAITRTALATSLILVVLAGEINVGPPVLASSMISLFATSYMPFIRSQARRTDITRKSFAVIQHKPANDSGGLDDLESTSGA